MATAYKHSGIQGTASVGTYTTLYVAPSSTEAVISSITVCNTAGSSATFRIGLDASAGTPGASEWLAYDAPIAANDTIALTLGIALATGIYIRVSSSANTLTFVAFVSEIT